MVSRRGAAVKKKAAPALKAGPERVDPMGGRSRPWSNLEGP